MRVRARPPTGTYRQSPKVGIRARLKETGNGRLLADFLSATARPPTSVSEPCCTDLFGVTTRRPKKITPEYFASSISATNNNSSSRVAINGAAEVTVAVVHYYYDTVAIYMLLLLPLSAAALVRVATPRTHQGSRFRTTTATNFRSKPVCFRRWLVARSATNK